MTFDQENMLDELLDFDGGLSGWEMDFIESLDNRRDRDLTAKQVAALDRLWDRCFGQGEQR